MDGWMNSKALKSCLSSVNLMHKLNKLEYLSIYFIMPFFEFICDQVLRVNLFPSEVVCKGLRLGIHFAYPLLLVFISHCTKS